MRRVGSWGLITAVSGIKEDTCQARDEPTLSPSSCPDVQESGSLEQVFTHFTDKERKQ